MGDCLSRWTLMSLHGWRTLFGAPILIRRPSSLLTLQPDFQDAWHLIKEICRHR